MHFWCRDTQQFKSCFVLPFSTPTPLSLSPQIFRTLAHLSAPHLPTPRTSAPPPIKSSPTSLGSPSSPPPGLAQGCAGLNLPLG